MWFYACWREPFPKAQVFVLVLSRCGLCGASGDTDRGGTLGQHEEFKREMFRLTLALAHVQSDVKCETVIVEHRIHYATLRVREFTDVATEECWQTSLKHSDGGFL